MQFELRSGSSSSSDGTMGVKDNKNYPKGSRELFIAVKYAVDKRMHRDRRFTAELSSNEDGKKEYDDVKRTRAQDQIYWQ